MEGSDEDQSSRGSDEDEEIPEEVDPPLFVDDARLNGLRSKLLERAIRVVWVIRKVQQDEKGLQKLLRLGYASSEYVASAVAAVEKLKREVDEIVDEARWLCPNDENAGNAIFGAACHWIDERKWLPPNYTAVVEDGVPTSSGSGGDHQPRPVGEALSEDLRHRQGRTFLESRAGPTSITTDEYELREVDGEQVELSLFLSKLLVPTMMSSTDNVRSLETKNLEVKIADLKLELGGRDVVGSRITVGIRGLGGGAAASKILFVANLGPNARIESSTSTWELLKKKEFEVADVVLFDGMSEESGLNGKLGTVQSGKATSTERIPVAYELSSREMEQMSGARTRIVSVLPAKLKNQNAAKKIVLKMTLEKAHTGTAWPMPPFLTDPLVPCGDVE